MAKNPPHCPSDEILHSLKGCQTLFKVIQITVKVQNLQKVLIINQSILMNWRRCAR